jgi:hypothetical protein
MKLFRRKVAALTGVGAILTAEHRSRQGHVHAHTWEVRAWFAPNPRYAAPDALCLRYALEEHLKPYQGTVLPDRIAWGEDMAEWICLALSASSSAPCVKVEISRHAERIYSAWPA